MSTLAATAARYARAGFRPLLPDHAALVEAAEAARGGARLRETLDRSLGAAVFLGRGAGARVLLIEQLSAGRRFWSLPKGHPEAGEDDAAAAAREVREETGVDVARALVAAPGGGLLWAGSAYTFCGAAHPSSAEAASMPAGAPREPLVVHKTVRYALADLGAAAAPPPLALQASEVAAAEFLPLAAALERLPHENDRAALRALAEHHARL